MSRLRLAVIGAGHLGRIHAGIAARLQGAQLVAVVDAAPEAARTVAAENHAKPLTDCRELFGCVDAAIVATPTSSHAQVASEMLQGGIHVLVEKPLTTTRDEAEQLVTLARRQQLTLQVGHVERFNPALTSVRTRLKDPKYIEARRLSTYTYRSTDIGVVHDLMIHDIDVVLHLVQSPLEQVEAVGISVLGQQEDMVSARLTFASGCVACLTASRMSYVAERLMQVFTPEKCATLDFAARRSSIIEPSPEILSRTFQSESLSVDEKAHLRDHLFTELLPKRELPTVEVNAIEQEQLDFASAIRTGTLPQVTGSDGLQAVAIAEKILEQVAAHSWDGVSGTFHGSQAHLPLADVIVEPDSWSDDDTVIIHRKAG